MTFNKIISIFLMQILFLTAALIPGFGSETLNMAYFILPPYFFDQAGTGNPEGAAIEYFEILSKKAGYNANWTKLPLLRLTEYLRIGKIDGTVGFPRFPEFEAFLYYVNKPLGFGQPIFVFKKDMPLDAIRSIDDIKGFRIGVGNSNSDRYTPVLDKNRDKVILYKTADLNWAELNLRHLMNGRLDALFDRQQYAIPYIARKLNLHNQIKTINAPDPAIPFYIVFSKSVPQNKSVAEKINQIKPEKYPDFKILLDKQFNLLK